MMTNDEKAAILERAKNWFRGLATQHIHNIEAINSLSAFQYNPFLVGYLSRFFDENPSPESLAKVLLYPRVLGPSINTLFGNAVKNIGSAIFGDTDIGIPGLDISFIDQTDGTRKYAVIKSGPITINQGYAQPMIDTFDEILASPWAAEQGLTSGQLVVVVVYGERGRMHGAYHTIEASNYPVLIGQEFWLAITGDANFYNQLIDSIAEIAAENNGMNLFEEKITLLASDPALIELSAQLGGQPQ